MEDLSQDAFSKFPGFAMDSGEPCHMEAAGGDPSQELDMSVLFQNVESLDDACVPAGDLNNIFLDPLASCTGHIPECAPNVGLLQGPKHPIFTEHIPPNSPLPRPPGASANMPLISPLRQHVSGASLMHPGHGQLSPAQTQMAELGRNALKHQPKWEDGCEPLPDPLHVMNVEESCGKAGRQSGGSPLPMRLGEASSLGEVGLLGGLGDAAGSMLLGDDPENAEAFVDAVVVVPAESPPGPASHNPSLDGRQRLENPPPGARPLPALACGDTATAGSQPAGRHSARGFDLTGRRGSSFTSPLAASPASWGPPATAGATPSAFISPPAPQLASGWGGPPSAVLVTPAAPSPASWGPPATAQPTPSAFVSPSAAPVASGSARVTPSAFVSPPAAPVASGSARAMPSAFVSPPAAPPVFGSGGLPSAVLATPAAPQGRESTRPPTGGPVTPWPDEGVCASGGSASGESRARCNQTQRSPHDARPSGGTDAAAVLPVDLPPAASVGPTPAKNLGGEGGTPAIEETPAQPIVAPRGDMAVRGPIGPPLAGPELSASALSAPRSVGELPPMTPVPLDFSRRFTGGAHPASSKDESVVASQEGAYTPGLATPPHATAAAAAAGGRGGKLRPSSAPARISYGFEDDPVLREFELCVRLHLAEQGSPERLAEEQLQEQLEEAVQASYTAAAKEAEAAAQAAAEEVLMGKGITTEGLWRVVERCQADAASQAGDVNCSQASSSMSARKSSWGPGGSYRRLEEGAVQRIVLNNASQQKWDASQDEGPFYTPRQSCNASRANSPACAVQRVDSEGTQPGKTPSRFARPSSTGRASLPPASASAPTRAPSPKASPAAAPPTTSRKRRAGPPKRFDDEENASDVNRRRKAALKFSAGTPPMARAASLKRKDSSSAATASRDSYPEAAPQQAEAAHSGGSKGHVRAGGMATRDPLTSLYCAGEAQRGPKVRCGFPPHAQLKGPGFCRPASGRSKPAHPLHDIDVDTCPADVLPEDIALSRLIIIANTAAPPGLSTLDVRGPGFPPQLCCVGRIMAVGPGPSITVAWYGRDTQGQWGPVVLGNSLTGAGPVQTVVDLSSPANALFATFASFTPSKSVPPQALIEAKGRLRAQGTKAGASERVSSSTQPAGVITELETFDRGGPARANPLDPSGRQPYQNLVHGPPSAIKPCQDPGEGLAPTYPNYGRSKRAEVLDPSTETPSKTPSNPRMSNPPQGGAPSHPHSANGTPWARTSAPQTLSALSHGISSLLQAFSYPSLHRSTPPVLPCGGIATSSNPSRNPSPMDMCAPCGPPHGQPLTAHLARDFVTAPQSSSSLLDHKLFSGIQSGNHALRFGYDEVAGQGTDVGKGPPWLGCSGNADSSDRK